MKNKKSGQMGREAFDEYYTEIFGARWEELKKSFGEENQSVEYKIEGSQKSYFLDSASVYAALNLPLKGAKNILDLCAAPGGKTLVLASRMDEDATLFSNERSPERKHRLDVVVEECLPQSISERIKTSCSDGATWCTRQSECFDRILLDAPCSSERHVFLDPKYLNIWTKSRIKTVAMEEWALLSGAYRLLEVGGILLYSTCALSPVENDEMIERLIKKYNQGGQAFKILEECADMDEIKAFTSFKKPGTEKTKYGYQILPDRQDGAGPIFFAIIQKQSSFLS